MILLLSLSAPKVHAQSHARPVSYQPRVRHECGNMNPCSSQQVANDSAVSGKYYALNILFYIEECSKMISCNINQ